MNDYINNPNVDNVDDVENMYNQYPLQTIQVYENNQQSKDQAQAQEQGQATKTQEIFDLDQYVGIVPEFTNPFQLYIRVNDIERNASIVKFIVFSIGARRALIWGYYNIDLQQIIVQSACTFKLNQLMPLLRQWEANAFESASVMTKHGIAQLMQELSLNSGETSKYIQYPEYQQLKYLIALLNDRINVDQFEELVNNNLLVSTLQKLNLYNPDIQYIEYENESLSLPNYNTLLSLLPQLNTIVEKYEKTINRNDLDRDLNLPDKAQYVVSLIQQIVDDFFHWLETSVYSRSSFYNILQPCLSETQCQQETNNIDSGYSSDSTSQNSKSVSKNSSTNVSRNAYESAYFSDGEDDYQPDYNSKEAICSIYPFVLRNEEKYR